MDRRRFLRGVLGGAAAIASAPLLAKLPAVKEATTLSRVDEVKVHSPGSLVRTEFKDGSWTVYDHNGVARVTFGTF